MYRLNPREEKMILLAIIIIGMVGFYKFLAIPYTTRWKTTTSQIQQLNTRVSQAKILQSGSSTVSFSQTTIMNQTTAIALLLENLEFWSDQAGVNMSSIKPGPSQDKGTVKELNFDVEVSGEMDSICRFINKIEEPSSITRINKIRISKPRDILRELNMMITVSTICLPESTPIKKSKIVSDINE